MRGLGAATALLLLVCITIPKDISASEYSSNGAQDFDYKGSDPGDRSQRLPRADFQDCCVFVLGTGRSGSTQLVDSLNQVIRWHVRPFGSADAG